MENCWHRNCVNTYKSIYKAIGIWLERGDISKDALSNYLISECSRWNKIVTSANGYVQMYREQAIWRERIRSVKLLAVQQLSDASRVIEGLMEEN